MALGCGSAQGFRGALFVWFSDDRQVEVVVRFGVALFVLIFIIIVVVGVSRRHTHDGDKAQPIGNFLGLSGAEATGVCADEED